jgi:hypothetical protein
LPHECLRCEMLGNVGAEIPNGMIEARLEWERYSEGWNTWRMPVVERITPSTRETGKWRLQTTTERALESVD